MEADGVDDTDHGGVHRRRLLSERFSGCPAFEHDKDLFVHARADAVDGEQRRAARRVVGVERLHEQQLGTFELLVLLRGHDGPNDLSNLHSALYDLKSPEIPVIDNADDAGIHGRFRGIERKACLFAADEKHFFADAGADRIDGDDRPPRRLTIDGERLDDQQLDAGELLVLPGRHDVADDARELHQSVTSISSMMPTIAASTGQSFNPDAMRAELPLTTSTVSPT